MDSSFSSSDDGVRAQRKRHCRGTFVRRNFKQEKFEDALEWCFSQIVGSSAAMESPSEFDHFSEVTSWDEELTCGGTVCVLHLFASTRPSVS